MSSSHSTYPIRAVARLTGLSIDTLRAWERRYQAVVPERSDRGRVYRDTHIARLKNLAALVESGHAIGTIAHLTDRQLGRLLEQEPAVPADPLPRAIDLDDVIGALDRFDLPAIDAMVNRSAMLLPAEPFITGVVLPLLRELGDRWQAEALTPAQEHLVSAAIRTVLGGLLRTMPRGDRASIVFATPPGERHELGLLAGAVLSAAAGFHVIYLGPDLPVEDIATAATQAKAAAMVLSITIADSRKEIARLGTLMPATALVLGGAKASTAAAGRHAHVVDALPDLVPTLLHAAR